MRQRGVAKPAPRSEISLSPRLARLLLNLSGLSPGQTLLDPFCGSGTILAEGMLRSLRCLGVDSSSNHIRDARRNLGWAKGNGGRGTFALKLGDARDLQAVLEGASVDGVVTEPVLLPRMDSRPSARVAGELMEAAGETYSHALSSIASVLNPGSRVVVVVPVVRTTEGSEASISLDGVSLGLRQFQPGPTGFQYPVRLSFESTRWVRRAVYVFESRR
jgi:tRNA (guanine10-N2)-dimethyltransferase